MAEISMKIISCEEHFKQIINELRKEYGTKRKGDTFMDETRLQSVYEKLVNKELEAVGIFENNNLVAYTSYKITEDGLYGAEILVFGDHRGKKYGNKLIEYMEEYAKQHNCKQIYFGARRSANNFYFKHGFEGTCLIQSDKATKKDLENLISKYGITDYSYNQYNGCNPPVNQVWINAKHINNQDLVDEIDNSPLDIGCILTFSKQINLKANKKAD